MASLRHPAYQNLSALLLLLAGSFPVNLSGQDSSGLSWTFDGSLRYRFERWDHMNALYYGNYPALGTPNDHILLQRIIAGPTLRFGNHVSLSVHMQDSRAFGWSLGHRNEPDAFKKHPAECMEPCYIMNPQEEFFELYDACLSLENIFNLITIKAGRQKIAFGDYRVFGPGSWGNTGRWTWDAIRITLDRHAYALNIWYGGTKIHDPLNTHFLFTHTEFNGGGLHFQLQTGTSPGTSFYVAHKNQGSADYIRDKRINRNWIGFRLYQPEQSDVRYEASLTWQFGKENNIRLNASGLFITAGYKFSRSPWKPVLSLRYTRASGDHPETVQNELFDPVFGASDRYYGWMNLVRWCNLDDQEIMLELFPLERMRIELKYNQFRIPEPEGLVLRGSIGLPSGKNHLGDELDLYATYDLNEKWKFAVLLGYFILKDGVITGEDPVNAFMIGVQTLYTFNLVKPHNKINAPI